MLSVSVHLSLSGGLFASFSCKHDAYGVWSYSCTHLYPTYKLGLTNVTDPSAVIPRYGCRYISGCLFASLFVQKWCVFVWNSWWWEKASQIDHWDNCNKEASKSKESAQRTRGMHGPFRGGPLVIPGERWGSNLSKFLVFKVGHQAISRHTLEKRLTHFSWLSLLKQRQHLIPSKMGRTHFSASLSGIIAMSFQSLACRRLA